MMKIKSPQILIIGTLITCMVGQCPTFGLDWGKKTLQNILKISLKTIMKKVKQVIFLS